MSRPPHLPLSEPVAEGDARRFAPSAGRNQAAILEMLRRHAPAQGKALEIASGTGQHIRAFAEALPGLTWQPTDLAPENLPSIRAWGEGQPNLRPPVLMDAAQPGWAETHGPLDLIVTTNLMHLIPRPVMQAVMAEVACALAPAGLWMLYGPFRRDGGFASEGDAAFDARLRAQAPAIGYKSVAEVLTALQDVGLCAADPVEMPANNLVFLAQPANFRAPVT